MQTDKQTTYFFSYDPPYSRGNILFSVKKSQCQPLELVVVL